MIKNVLIDLDDTLWDTQGNNKRCLREMYEERHWGHYYDSFDDFYGLYEPHNLRMWDLYRQGKVTKQELTIGRFAPVLERVGLCSEEEIERFSADFLRRTSLQSGVVPGAIELLEDLSVLYRIVVVSNGFREVQRAKMDAAGLTPYVQGVVLSEDVGSSKPFPAIFRRAFSLLGARPSESIMIGDSWEADVLGAQGVKIPAVWYAPSASLPSSVASLSIPVHHVRKLSEVPAVLRHYLPL